MSVEEKEELMRVLIELLRTDQRLRYEVWNCVCACPNVVVEY